MLLSDTVSFSVLLGFLIGEKKKHTWEKEVMLNFMIIVPDKQFFFLFKFKCNFCMVEFIFNVKPI